MMLKIESLLYNRPATFQVTVEADICNALTNLNYYVPRFFTRRFIGSHHIKVEVLQGGCGRAQTTTLQISHNRLN